MKVYELHFNPSPDKQKGVYHASCFEPENIYETRRGRLFMMGTVKKDSASNNLLVNVSDVIKDGFYAPTSSSPAKSLRRGLKKGNEFLRQIVEKGEVEWISSFGFAALTLTLESPLPSQEEDFEKYELNFTRVKNIEIILLRAGEAVNLGERVKETEIEPYPLTVFSSIVSGQLREGDKVLILSKEIYKSFLEQNFLKKLAGLSVVNDKKISRTLKIFLEQESEGACLFIDLGKDQSGKKRKILFQKDKKKFKPGERIKELPSQVKESVPFVSDLLEKIGSAPRPDLSGMKRIFKKLTPSLPRIPAPELPGVPRPKIRVSKKQVVPLVLLVILILGGRMVSRVEKQETITEVESKLEIVETKRRKAEQMYVSGRKKDSRVLYLEAWQEIKRLSKTRTSLLPEILKTKEEIHREILEVNNFYEIEEPELLFQFKEEEFLPQKFVLLGENMFFSSPYTEQISVLGSQPPPFFMETELKITELTPLTDKQKIVFLDNEGRASILNEELGDTFSLIDEQTARNSTHLSSFRSNLYLWNEKQGQIIRLPYLGGMSWGDPEDWLDKPLSGNGSPVRSMAIDGGIWILKDKKLLYFYRGQLKKTLSPEIFPPIKQLSRIFTLAKTNLLYLTEPVGNRIIVVDKESGEVRAQYHSDRFKNLKDVAISESKGEIYVLNGAEVFRIRESR